ncbi:MAG TPA: pitrilysin family protein [Polyangiaceae bacterium]
MKPLATLLLLAAAIGCGGAPPVTKPAPVPVKPPPPALTAEPVDPLAEPPPPGVAPSLPFPSVAHRRLDNGMGIAIVPRRGFPTIELRLVAFSGQATDGTRTGVAALTGKLLKDGGAGNWTSRQLVERAEGLGTRLVVSTDRDSTRIGLSVTSSSLEPALEILAAVAMQPRFSPEEFAKLKQREIDRVKDRARTSPSWLAAMVLYRELYEMPVTTHPYARYDAMPGELAELKLADARDWYRKHITAENTVLVVSGDVEPDAVERAVKQRFAAFRGPRPTPTSFSDARGPGELELFVVDRPESTQSQVLLATLGPERKHDAYPALMTANQILGGGVSGRLFLDVRERRSLAYSTSSWIEEPANGPMPIVLSAGTQTARTADAVAALLEHFEKIGTSAPSAEEAERAARYLSDSFLFKMETAGAIAELTAKLLVLGLQDDAYDEYRHAVRQLDPEQISVTAGRYFEKGRVIVVVAGDANVVAKPLTRFAKVSVIDPEHGFVIARTHPRESAAAPSPPPTRD